MFERKETVEGEIPSAVGLGTGRLRGRSPLESSDRSPEVWTSGFERRQHRRTSPPSLRNGWTYSLRSVAVAVPLVVSDLAALLASIFAAAALVSVILPSAPLSGLRLFSVLGVGLVTVNASLGLYPSIGVPPVVERKRSALAICFLVGAFVLASFLHEVDPALRWILFATGLASLVAAPVARSLTRWMFARFSWWSQPLLILGTGRSARRLSTYYAKSPGLGLTPVMVPDLCENGATNQFNVAELASRYGAVCAAVVLGGASRAQETALLRECVNTFPSLLIVPEMGGLHSTSSGVTDVGGVTAIRVGKRLLLPAPRAVKRLMDLTLALLLGVICLPVGVIIALAVKSNSSGGVFYGHERIGRNRKPFVAWKFRTMYANSDELLEGWLSSNDEVREEWTEDRKLRNDPRLTRVGRFLRKTSLDELPQLWNVLRGEMSLVGPRPIVEDEVGKYGMEFERYLSVVPGLSGLWQVSGRNRTTYEERVHLDSLYVEKWSPMWDAYILAKTIKAVVTGDGAY